MSVCIIFVVVYIVTCTVYTTTPPPHSASCNKHTSIWARAAWPPRQALLPHTTTTTTQCRLQQYYGHCMHTSRVNLLVGHRKDHHYHHHTVEVTISKPSPSVPVSGSTLLDHRKDHQCKLQWAGMWQHKPHSHHHMCQKVNAPAQVTDSQNLHCRHGSVHACCSKQM